MSILMSGQKHWKKAGLKSSEPGDLSGFIWFTALVNSSILNWVTSILLCSFDTLG